MDNSKEINLFMPPAIHAIAALAAVDDEDIDGVPQETKSGNIGGVRITQDATTFTAEATNGRMAGRYTASIKERPAISDGKFPNLDAVMPKDKPQMTIRFDAGYLIDLLTACQRVAGDVGIVEMDLRGSDKLIVVRARDYLKSREFTGLLVPKSIKDGEAY